MGGIVSEDITIVQPRLAQISIYCGGACYVVSYIKLCAQQLMVRASNIACSTLIAGVMELVRMWYFDWQVDSAGKAMAR